MEKKFKAGQMVRLKENVLRGVLPEGVKITGFIIEEERQTQVKNRITVAFLSDKPDQGPVIIDIDENDLELSKVTVH